MKITAEELEKLCMPIIEVLRRSGPYMSVVIRADSISVEQTDMFIPLNQNTDQLGASRCFDEIKLGYNDEVYPVWIEQNLARMSSKSFDIQHEKHRDIGIQYHYGTLLP